MALVGNVYVQASDPGAVGYGYLWANSTTGDVKARNTSNTAWVLMYNSNTVQGGSVPITGAAMQGALTGVTGWAPLDAPNFSTSASLAGISLATTNDLTNLQTTLTNLINGQIASGLNALSASASINNSVASDSGTIAHGGTIPLPSYSDRQALHSEIVLMHVSIQQLDLVDRDVQTRTLPLLCEVNPSTRVVTCSCYTTTGEYPQDDIRYGTANYSIICVKG